MAKVKVEDIRNVALCGHGSSGKTTLADTFLVQTGTVNSLSPMWTTGPVFATSIPKKSTTSIRSKPASSISIIRGNVFICSTPPAIPDFIGQTIGALHGVDLALIVVNAHAGMEVNTRRVFDEAERAGVGRMIVLSKLDDENVDFPALIESIQELWGPRCVLLNVPLGHGRTPPRRGQHSPSPRRCRRRPDGPPRNPRTADRIDH
jgi:elongation factor G